jgi:hypothetical protein
VSDYQIDKLESLTVTDLLKATINSIEAHAATQAHLARQENDARRCAKVAASKIEPGSYIIEDRVVRISDEYEQAEPLKYVTVERIKQPSAKVRRHHTYTPASQGNGDGT